jgi:UDP-N-acetylmuramoyl-tripeptide--D-alanyl-D-alanine ligase
MEITELYPYYLQCSAVCTDTRKLSENCLFIALKGPNFNGNRFAGHALKEGAAFAVVDEWDLASEGLSPTEKERLLLVEDGLSSLQALGRYHRRTLGTPIVALTGSNGKTTTKELISAVLSHGKNTLATEGNLNNHIGVPLTLLRLKKETEIAVVEMGANHQKEIAFLCSLAEPDYGYITNFGKAHLEGFGGVEGVIKGKSEMYDYLLSAQKTVFLNADDPIQREKLEGYVQKIGFSRQDSQYFKIELREEHPHLVLEAEGVQLPTNLSGVYNFTNCAAAVLIGKYFGIPLENIKSALQTYVPQNMRSQWVEKGEHRILLDAYNANPTSMMAALGLFDQLESETKWAILGDMFELGKAAEEEHQAVADYLKKMRLKEAYLVGEHFYGVQTDLPRFESFELLAEHLKNNPLSPGSILIKGSRGMALERLLDIL